ncbi:hypothetical protein [Legionella maioricensis]|uniref:Uncharacterized protein n=1 Tax=Legionella maioricensis TaxID=2896528 RepID=A0A9X2D2L3_9GAMM|nr:hypothetical protein [Legionella maioricensis]MCL9685331.1 hypothetical protein [Legionella maioricensis]MCL9688707.1 hypothetical protein [Legionella maioricensis]
MNKVNNQMSGYIDAMLYVMLASIAFVFLDDLCSDVEPLTALFVMSGIAIFCFNLLCLRNLKTVYDAILQNPFLFLMMSTALGLDWLCMVYATYLSDPFITMTSLFISSAFLGFFSLYRKSGTSSYRWSMLILVSSILILFFKYEIQKPGSTLFGILLGILAGLAFYIYMLTSEQLCARAKLTSIQVLATRFWVLFIGSSLFIHLDTLHAALKDNARPLIAVSIGSLVIPIFFNQQAIRKLGTATTSVIISLVPITTYLIYAFWNGNLVFTNLLIGLVITSALALPQIIGARS